MSDDSGLPTLEAGSSSENTSVASLEEENHINSPLTGLFQRSALEHLSFIILDHHNWHVTARPATETWMHLSALKAFSLQPALITSGKYPSFESLSTLQSSSSSEATDASTSRAERNDSFNTPSAECSADNIFAVLASLCTSFELKAIKNLQQFTGELEWIAKGPDLTTSNLIDICFDVSLSTPPLIKYLRSSQVPLTTVQTLPKVKASAEF